MKNKKHKIFLYPLEENGKVRVFLFQSGDIGNKRGDMNFTHNSSRFRGCVHSAAYPQIQYESIAVNGWIIEDDYRIHSKPISKSEFEKLKELENAYNNREE